MKKNWTKRDVGGGDLFFQMSIFPVNTTDTMSEIPKNPERGANPKEDRQPKRGCGHLLNPLVDFVELF